MSTAPYVIITACKNEALFINDLVKTIAAQTVRPVKWLIIDDNSSDATYELAKKVSYEIDFIEVRKANSKRDRSFSSQVYAQQEGYAVTRDFAFDFVAFLDADIQLPPDYYEKCLAYFAKDAKLAIVGGLVVDKIGDTVCRARSKSVNHHVPGGVQCFRRRSYEEVGGYLPIEGGGQDTVAEIMCMMRGGKVQSVLDIEALHLRPSEGSNHYLAGTRWGRMCYNLGYHPLYYVATMKRAFRQQTFHQARGRGRFTRFWLPPFKRKHRPVPPEFVKFIRQLQLRKLRSAISFNHRG